VAKKGSPEYFAERMDRLSMEFPAKAARLVRRVAVVVDQVLVMGTPVDTGRARAGWTATVGEARANDPGYFGPPGDTRLAGQATRQAQVAAQISIAMYKPGSPPIYIANVVPYISYLERGTSTQAPHGMIWQAVWAGRSAMRRFLRDEPLLKGK